MLRGIVCVGLGIAVWLCGAGAVADQTREPEPSAAEERARIEALPASVRAERELLVKGNDAAVRRKAAEAYLAEAETSPSKREAAAGHVRAVLDQNPNDVEALILMGRIELDWKRPAVAVLHLRNAVRLAPDNATAQLNLGSALTQLGDEKGATAAYAEFRRIMGMPAMPPPSAATAAPAAPPNSPK